eukprot:GHVS01087259.1.p1 GENE.GHVS01087259.1~~GHVS01087259.1.p1  ORF type:complete len:310 (-),score=80.12 GHVS01087259.1:191-1078(-)
MVEPTTATKTATSTTTTATMNRHNADNTISPSQSVTLLRRSASSTLMAPHRRPHWSRVVQSSANGTSAVISAKQFRSDFVVAADKSNEAGDPFAFIECAHEHRSARGSGRSGRGSGHRSASSNVGRRCSTVLSGVDIAATRPPLRHSRLQRSASSSVCFNNSLDSVNDNDSNSVVDKQSGRLQRRLIPLRTSPLTPAAVAQKKKLHSPASVFHRQQQPPAKSPPAKKRPVHSAAQESQFLLPQFLLPQFLARPSSPAGTAAAAVHLPPVVVVRPEEADVFDASKQTLWNLLHERE